MATTQSTASPTSCLSKCSVLQLQNVCRLISHKDQTRITIDEAYIFYTEARVAGDKRISVITEDVQPPQSEQEIAAFQQLTKPPQRQGGQQGNGRQSRYRRNKSQGNNFQQKNNSTNRQNSVPGSNNACNGKFCIYCKIMGHVQQECSKRIRENKPWVDSNGCTFWPKLNTTSENTS